MDEDAVDFAIAVWREEGRWAAELLPPHASDSLDALIHAVRQIPGDSGAIAFVSVAEEFFVAVRVHGPEVRLMLSDATSAHDWPLAAEVAERIGAAIPGDDDELDEVVPVGDLRIFSDLGFTADELDMLCSNIELYPDQVIGSVATRVGFGDQYESALAELD